MNLDPHQTAAAEHPAARLRLVAGPGAGKTRVVAARVAHLLRSGAVLPSQVACCTLTRAMARDLRAAVAAATPREVQTPLGPVAVEGLLVGTIHGLAAGLLRRVWAGELAGRQALAASGLLTAERFAVATAEDVEEAVAAAKRAVGRKAGVRALAAFVNSGAAPDDRPECEARRELVSRGLLTPDDLLGLLARAAAMRGASTIHEAHPCLVVDEAQDVGTLAAAALDAWAPARLTVAGDDGQALYDFLGGGAWFRDLEVDATVRLGRDYRAAQKVHDLGADLRARLAGAGACTPVEADCVRRAPGDVLVQPTPETHGAPLVLDALLTFAPHEVAVLAPTHAELAAAAHVLAQAGIPVAEVERAGDAWRSVTGRAVVAAAQAASQHAVTAWQARTICAATGTQDRRSFEAHLAEAFEVGRAIEAQLPHLQPLMLARGPRALHRLADWTAAQPGPVFARLADRLRAMAEADPRATVSDFLASLSEDEPVAAASGVTLATWHAAKGREWPAVVVLGADHPPPWGEPETWARARYVACTRARDFLAVEGEGAFLHESSGPGTGRAV